MDKEIKDFIVDEEYLEKVNGGAGAYVGPCWRYTINWGDTLSGIAYRYGSTVNELAAINGISNPDKIYAGKSLLIPYRGTSRLQRAQ